MRLITIGNSKGFRIPQPILQQVGFGDDVDYELKIQDGGLFLKPKQAEKPHPRTGWAEDFAKLAAEGGEDEFKDWREIPNDFDEEEWTW